MVQIKNNNFSLAQISKSGQCFRMNELGGGRYALTAYGRYLELTQKADAIFFDCTEEEFEQVWNEYFDLNTDYGKIIALADDGDLYLQKAVDYGKGIRILRQDAWEMVISFIISQQNNIKRIRKCIDLLCTRYGEEKRTKEGRIYYAFPVPESLAAASLEELYACNLGYRSRYVKQTAQSIAAGTVDLDKISQMEYPRSAGELKKLCGVGDKVADCISLFGLHQLDAFPRDVHINRVLENQYPSGFPFEKYKGYVGVLQQYIFYYDLTV